MSNPSFRKVLQYLWDSEPSNSDPHEKIVCLGIQHDPQKISGTRSTEDLQRPWPSDFLDDVESRMWLTYRTGFKLIPRSKEGPSTISIGGILRGSGIDLTGFTSDVGWGCMIRTGQSLLANTLMILKLGRSWRLIRDSPCLEEIEIAKLFCDEPSAPFSIHKFVYHGETACGKKPGEWFGPSAAASSIKHLCEQTNLLKVYIATGSDIYINKLLATAKENDEFHPTLVLLGVRLGIDKVNEVYYHSLKACLDCSQAVGIAGGRPSASHYFFGYQGNSLFYLDPHQPRPKLQADDGQLNEIAVNSLHTRRIRMLKLEEMDPSMLLGFLLKSEKDFLDWKNTMSQMDLKSSIVNFFESEPQVLRRPSYMASRGEDDEFIDVSLENLCGDESDKGFASTDSLVEQPTCGSYVSIENTMHSMDTGTGSYDSAELTGPAAIRAHEDVEEEPVMIGSYISNADGEEWEEMMGSVRANAGLLVEDDEKKEYHDCEFEDEHTEDEKSDNERHSPDTSYVDDMGIAGNIEL